MKALRFEKSGAYNFAPWINLPSGQSMLREKILSSFSQANEFELRMNTKLHECAPIAG